MIHAHYFKPEEFRGWAEDMSPRLVTMLDVLRHTIDRTITISAHPDSLGRHKGPDALSAHNIDKWGSVLAADVFVGMVYTKRQAADIVQQARWLGFTGIGVYPEWTNNHGANQVGFHFDVRPSRAMGDPSEWGYLGGKMVTIQTALNALPVR